MSINIESVMNSLNLMVMGMAAIFMVIIIIYAAVTLMLKTTAEKK
jgi:Na+-transporting methylmalonyl-CoA/oxaloacetate decarboxylase gamma subunit